jgi:MoxR-like ATPase
VGGLHRRQAPVLLIDEIDKADIEFPNDLLQELDRMEFYVYETDETVKADSAADRHHHLEQ